LQARFAEKGSGPADRIINWTITAAKIFRDHCKYMK